MEQQEELLTQKRLMDLSRLADRKGTVIFSNFLNLNEINLFHQIKSDIVTSYRLFGGYDYAERQMIAFIPDALSYTSAQAAWDTGAWEFPISCLHVTPTHKKFAEQLTHRDVLGALMSLGIDRSRIGDIKIDGYDYYMFCDDGIADYLLGSLHQIRHTMVAGEKCAPASLSVVQKFEQMTGVVASERLDNVVSFAVKKPRSQSVSLIQAQKVFVNARSVISNAYVCKEGDVISIRGFGKFLFEKCGGETRKGRTKIILKKYI